MVQRVEVLSYKTEDLSLILKPHLRYWMWYHASVTPGVKWGLETGESAGNSQTSYSVSQLLVSVIKIRGH